MEQVHNICPRNMFVASRHAYNQFPAPGIVNIPLPHISCCFSLILIKFTEKAGYHFVPSPHHSLLPTLFRWLGQESLLSWFPKDSISHKAASHRFMDYPTIYFSTSSVLTGSGQPSRLCSSAIIFVSCASSLLRGISSDTTAEAVFGVIRETPAVDHHPSKIRSIPRLIFSASPPPSAHQPAPERIPPLLAQIFCCSALCLPSEAPPL